VKGTSANTALAAPLRYAQIRPSFPENKGLEGAEQEGACSRGRQASFANARNVSRSLQARKETVRNRTVVPFYIFILYWEEDLWRIARSAKIIIR